MKKLLLISAAILLFTATNAQERSIEVIAEEEMELIPDELTVAFSLTQKHNSKGNITGEYEETVEIEAENRSAQPKPTSNPKNTTIAEKQKAIAAYLAKNGVVPTIHLIEGLTSTNKYSKETKSYTLKLNNREKFNTILQGIDSLGADQISIQAIKSNKEEHYRVDLAIKALQKAKTKAEKLLAVYDEKVGKVISISENFNDGGDTRDFYMKLFEQMIRKEAGTTFTINVSYKVKVKFAIQ